VAAVSDEMARALLAASERLAPKMAGWHAQLARSTFVRFGLESQVSPALNEALNVAEVRELRDERNRKAKEAAKGNWLMRKLETSSNSKVSVLEASLDTAAITEEMVAEVAQAEEGEGEEQSGRRSLFTASDVAKEQAAVEALAQRWIQALPPRDGESLRERLDLCGPAADVERLLIQSVSEDNAPVRAELRARFLRAVENLAFHRMHQKPEAEEETPETRTDDEASGDEAGGDRIRFMTADEFTNEMYSSEGTK
jgi:hypothetical protein